MVFLACFKSGYECRTSGLFDTYFYPYPNITWMRRDFDNFLALYRETYLVTTMNRG